MSDRDARIAWFKAVVLPHEPALHRHLRRSIPSAETREDIVAEALTRAYAAADWSRITHGRNYLFTIARHLILDQIRRARVVSFDTFADLDLLGIADDRPTADSIVAARDELRRLQAAVDRLPPQCRKVFVMRRIEEKSPGEIAVSMGLSVSTVEKHLARAIALLTAALADDGGPEERAAGTEWRSTVKR